MAEPTTYVVLRQQEATGPNPDGNRPWNVAGEVEAASAEAAIRAKADDKGTWVAVPSRSWKPVTVTVETKREVRLS